MQPPESNQLAAVNSRQTLQGTDMTDIKELAAPSSDEVAQMVERLRSVGNNTRRDAAFEAADMIERLAARVPDGYMVVPREPTPKMDFAGAKAAEDMMSATVSKSMGTLGGHVIRDDYDDITLAYVNDEISSVMGIYKAMIAAGEVKP